MQNTSPRVSFGVIADLQYCDSEPFKNRFYRNSIRKLEETKEQLNSRQLDFVINLGDMIDKDWESYEKILPYFKHIKAPVYHVLGNHDYEVEEDKKAMIPGKIRTKKFYHFSLADWRFIVLGGNEISTFANLPQSENYQLARNWLDQMESDEIVNANFWNGGIGKTQLDWLESVLKDVSLKGQKAVIFCHYPIFPPNKHNLLNDKELLTLLKNCKGVKMWINGHNHKGNYGLFEDIHFVNVKGMVEGKYESAWSVVDLYENQISISGSGIEVSARLTF
jgi:manganese-dependent ADP-ribose/CDP-alcohol diphosphatase